jgi:hypothetical protein
MILMVSYDLKQSAGSYTALFEILKGEENWWHYLASTWLVETDKSPRDFSGELVAHTYKGDRLLVTELSSNRAGWLPTKAWDWIKARE